MHDIKAIRDNPAAFDAAWARKKLEAQSPRILELDASVRAATTRKQEAEAARNAASKQIGQAKAQKDEARASTLMAEVAALKETIEQASKDEATFQKQRDDILASLPNLPFPDVPDGVDEEGNIEVRKWYKIDGGDAPTVDLSADHVTIGEGLGLMDFEAATRMSGSRFVVLKAGLARLERALAAFMLDIHTTEKGYQEVSPPLLVKDEAAFGTGQLPKFGDDLFSGIFGLSPVAEFASDDAERRQLIEYAHSVAESIRNVDSFISDAAIASAMERCEAKEYVNKVRVNDEPFLKRFRDDAAFTLNAFYRADEATDFLENVLEEWDANALRRVRENVSERLWLIPTAEVSLTNLVREQILDEAALPLRMTADTPCFRAEAGAAGRDTRGMIRMHQFRKVEMVSIVAPENSSEEHERMTACAEDILKRLELPYRVMLLCAGDMGFGARKTYDLEVWLPSQGKYREISSCSNCGDFQARRMNARYRDKDGKPQFVHTLNGSGLAVGRTLVAILENYQNADGSVRVPKALAPYMGGLETITR
jgi:seryl-tRNA synthetase